MKTLCYMRGLWLAVVMAGLSSGVSAQEPGLVVVDPTVARSAQAAVQKMGVEMMKGNYQYANTRMYPRWKRRLAKRYGGVDKLERGLAKAGQQKVDLGLMVTAYNAELPTSFFSVWRAKKRDVSGALVKDATGRDVVVEHWLAVVPTLTRVKVADPSLGGKIRTLEEHGYTVAISEKGTNDWYFLTGMSPNIQDLRGMFPTLPPNEKDLNLPVSSVKEIK